MNRIEENAKLLQKIMEQIKENNSCCYEEFQLFQLGSISSLLADISKSLAILADKVESEEKDGDE